MDIVSNVELYDWVPFFKEVCAALFEIGKSKIDRTQILRKTALQIFGNNHAFSKYSLIDPFSFIYALAQKNTANQKVEVYNKVIDILNLSSKDPSDTIFPSPSPNSSVFFFSENGYITRDGQKINADILWDCFADASTRGTVNEEHFKIIISLKGVRTTKLTQVLFLINPAKFWSIDTNSLWLPIFSEYETTEIKSQIEEQGLQRYLHVLELFQNSFPGCKFYEINLLCWLLSGEEPYLKITNHFCQISSKVDGGDGDDYYEEFIKANAVWTGDDGKHIGGYALNKVKDGDIVLVRRGTRNLGGIGIVVQNEFESGGYNSDKAIYIIWLNKESRKLDYGLGDWKGFNESATDDTYEKFYSKYSDTLDLVEKLLAKQKNLPFTIYTPTIQKLNKNMYPKNIILYGPPGTGKTFHTITKAAEIISGESFDKRYDEARILYNAKLNEGQVEFVTFHQNYSYEDFVAGLRPDTSIENNQLKFKEHKGVFHRICQKAKENWNDYNRYLNGEKYKFSTFEEILNEFLKPLAEKDEAINLATLARNVSFKIYSINEKNLGLEKQSGSRDHTLSINTLKALYEERREYNLQGLGVYYYPTIDKLKQIATSLKKEIQDVKLNNYVLVIDEINRANISRVFGELITLLEPDKRIGEKNELLLRLPGLPDDELFGVPPNLYLVGTMNTADKSIALIDIALRRRFVFEDMYPREDIINSTVPEQYRRFLVELNKKIKELKGPDFMIGHAYFIPEEDKNLNILQVLNQKVIPLLNEYFYNQRSNPVFGLLNTLAGTLPGVIFEQDDFIGVKAKTTNDNNA